MERQVGQPDTPQRPRPNRAGMFSWQAAACVGLVVLCGVALFVVFRSLPPTNGLADPPEGNPKPQQLFQGWGKPQVAVVVSGQTHGYLQPCGCSKPQYGGLVRRYNFIEGLKAQGWPLVAVDVGDIPQKSGPQTLVKYRFSMQALKSLGYSGVGVGPNEMNLPLLTALSEHTLNDPAPTVLAANVVNPQTNQVVRALLNKTTVVKNPGAPTVGVIGLVAPSVYQKVNDPMLNFPPNNAVILQDALKSLQDSKVQFTVLLYHGTQKEAEALADHCAKNFQNLPNLDLIVHVSDHSEPPANPVQVAGTKTELVTTGHKGRYVGVVGVFPSTKAGRSFELKYQLVSIGPEFDTPMDKIAGHPIMSLMEDYALDVKNGNYLGQFPVNLHEVQVKFAMSEYVGSDKCQRCHQDEYKVWKDSHHSHAFATLVDAKHPSNRQFDGECVVCHVTGFEHLTGYGDALQGGNPQRAQMLENVGCESCHGPGSDHIKDKKNQAIHAAMNPWKHRDKPVLAMDVFCQKCHDVDNDVHWNFEKKWPKIVHKKGKPQPVNAPAGGNNAAANPPGAQAPVNETDGNAVTPAVAPKKDD